MPLEAGAIPGDKRTPEARQPHPDLLSCFADLSCIVKECPFGLELATPSVSYLSSGYGKMVHPLRHTPGQPWLASRVCDHPDFANRAAGRALHGLIQRFFCVR
jgi:hypothetical protein